MSTMIYRREFAGVWLTLPLVMPQPETEPFTCDICDVVQPDDDYAEGVSDLLMHCGGEWACLDCAATLRRELHAIEADEDGNGPCSCRYCAHDRGRT